MTIRTLKYVIAALATGSSITSAGAQRFPPDSFTNLKVLPKSIAPRELVNLMASFTRALGVRCSHCHVGDEGKPLETYDFAADDKLLKRKAREMLRLVDAINEERLPKLEERVEPRLTVSCATCHRGVREPRSLQEILLTAYRAAGLDSALTAYRSLRERYHGRAAYDFGDVPLADVAGAVWGMDRTADAERLLALNVETNPASIFAQRQHATRAIELAFRDGGSAAGTARYRELKGRYQPDAMQEPILNQVGYALLRWNRVADAVAAFKLNVEAYPNSWNAHDSLAEGYATSGDRAKAIESYERSLALNPRNENAARKLEELRR